MKRLLLVVFTCFLFISSILSLDVFAEISNNTLEDVNDKTVLSKNISSGEFEYNPEYLQFLEDFANGNIEEYGDIIPDSLPDIDIIENVTEANDDIASTGNEETVSYPTIYDPRILNLTTPVKNQGAWGLCWSFSAIAGMEAYLKKDTEKTYDLSENYYNYLAARDAIENETNPYSYYHDLTKSGNAQYVFSSFIGGYGAFCESTFPYSVSGQITDINILTETPEIYGYSYDMIRSISASSVSEYTNNERINKVKSFIYENGNCVISQKINDFYNIYFDPSNHSMYVPLSESKGTSHSVCIVGWDDTYSKDNFLVTPSQDGAFIVKNSWGSGWGNTCGAYGYYYLSYDDKFLNTVSLYSFSDVSSEKKYDYLDSYLFLPPDSLNTDDTVFYLANVFPTNAERDQEIVALGVQTLYDGAEFEVYVNPYNSTLSTSTLTRVYSGVAETAGYHTFELENPISIDSSNGKYAVVVKFLNDGSGMTTKGHYACHINSGSVAGESFYSTSGDTWEDVSLSKHYNYYINAYTNFVESPETVSVRFTKPSYWGSDVKIYAWDSSNPEITYTAAWPGDSMTEISNGEYEFINSNISSCNIVINSDGGTRQTSDFTVSGKVLVKNNVLVQRGSKQIEVLFHKPSSWGNDVKIYYYSNDGNATVANSWPGTSMKDIGQGYYSYTITNMENVRVIFTNGSYQYPGNNQPGIVATGGQKLICDGSSYSYEDSSNLKILFKKPDSWGDNVYIHLWDTVDEDTSWPGEKMTLMPGGYYQYTNYNVYKCNAIISDGTNINQLKLIDLCGYKTIINNTVVENSKDDILIEFKKPSGWNAPNLYYYSNDGTAIETASWPGYAMSYDYSTQTYWYRVSDMAYVNILFTDGTYQIPSVLMTGFTGIAGQVVSYDNGVVTYSFE